MLTVFVIKILLVRCNWWVSSGIAQKLDKMLRACSRDYSSTLCTFAFKNSSSALKFSSCGRMFSPATLHLKYWQIENV